MDPISPVCQRWEPKAYSERMRDYSKGFSRQIWILQSVEESMLEDNGSSPRSKPSKVVLTGGSLSGILVLFARGDRDPIRTWISRADRFANRTSFSMVQGSDLAPGGLGKGRRRTECLTSHSEILLTQPFQRVHNASVGSAPAFSDLNRTS